MSEAVTLGPISLPIGLVVLFAFSLFVVGLTLIVGLLFVVTFGLKGFGVVIERGAFLSSIVVGLAFVGFLGRLGCIGCDSLAHGQRGVVGRGFLVREHWFTFGMSRAAR